MMMKDLTPWFCAARADLIVTGDRALLDVGAYQGTRIVGVAEALGVITER